MTNTTLLKVKVLQSNKYPKLKDLAEDLGVSRSSLSSKMHNRNGSRFSVPEIKKLQGLLELSNDDVINIFFA